MILSITFYVQTCGGEHVRDLCFSEQREERVVELFCAVNPYIHSGWNNSVATLSFGESKSAVVLCHKEQDKYWVYLLVTTTTTKNNMLLSKVCIVLIYRGSSISYVKDFRNICSFICATTTEQFVSENPSSLYLFFFRFHCMSGCSTFPHNILNMYNVFVFSNEVKL